MSASSPGSWDYDDLIADTHDGILMETNRSWSIDDPPLPVPVFHRKSAGEN